MRKDYEYMDEVERFVFDLWDESIARNEMYSLSLAESDLKDFRRVWGEDVPEDLTPALLMNIWNDLVLSRYEMVVNADDRLVPRTSEMDNKQIANVIRDAYSWDAVDDLVTYVDDNFLHLEKDSDGVYKGNWEKAIEDWCDSQR